MYAAIVFVFLVSTIMLGILACELQSPSVSLGPFYIFFSQSASDPCAYVPS